jgi:arylsulfatase
VNEKKEQSSKKPNILLLFTDQQRADTIHALGNEYIQTPNMDRLCREGAAFERAYSPSPVCVPGRCCMYYGQYPFKTGCYDNSDPMPQDIPSMMHILSENGYCTHGIGKMHFTPDPHALRGFTSRERQEELMSSVEEDEYLKYLCSKGYTHIFDPHGQRSEMYYIPQISQLPAEDHPTQWVGDRSIEFLKAHEGETPFFLMSSFIHPHPPFSPPTPWNKLYRAREMSHANVPENYKELITYTNHFQNRYKYRDQGIDKNLVRTQKAFYYACISFIDYQIGRILSCLEDIGELDNTLILLTSDHGEMLGDYNCFGKRTMLDPAARVTMLARLPSCIPAGIRSTEPVSLVDVMPTILDAAQISKRPEDLDGESLFKVAEGKSARSYVYSQFQKGNLGLYMIASKDYKYIYSAPDDKEYFIDNSKDADETINLIKDHVYTDTVSQMKEKIISVLSKYEDGTAVRDSDWIRYDRMNIPSDPDEYLLFQDNYFAKDFESLISEGYSLNLFT